MTVENEGRVKSTGSTGRNFFARWFFNLSIRKKLYLPIAAVLIVVVLFVCLAKVQMDILSALRAFVNQESSWSKGQKDAIYYLKEYVNYCNEEDYRKFLMSIKVPLGDGTVRRELEKPHPDFNVSYQGFIDGRAHPEDIDGMTMIFRRLRNLSYVDNAIKQWEDGDALMNELAEIGDEAHKAISSGDSSDEAKDQFLVRINENGAKHTEIENQFSYSLGEASRWVKGILTKVMFAFAIVVFIALFLGMSCIARAISIPLNRAARVTGLIANGDLTQKLGLDRKDELGELAVAFDAMSQKLLGAKINLEKKNKELVEAQEKTQKACDSALAATRLKSAFLANMSHEIRTPMNAVIGFSNMLLDTDLDENQIDYAKTIIASGEALLSLIDDILDFSKIEAGALDFEQTDFDPELLAYEVCDIIHPKIESKPIEILCHTGDNLPSMVRGDPGRFRQVLVNLMGNSSKFTESGEIEVALDVEKETDKNIKLHAKVRDTGIGIPKEKLASIFKPFEQVDTSTTRRYGGTGLGLTISRQIANLASGDIWAESEVGKGSTFHATAWFEKVEEKEAKRIIPVLLSNKKVLIVDDNRRNLDILTNILELVVMRVVALARGEEVMPTLQRALENNDPFDLCALDICMPGMSGYEVAKQIRDSRSGKQISDIPLIALSSLMERDARKCKNSGFDGFLSKPVHREKLYQILGRMMGKTEGEGEEDKAGKREIITRYSVMEDMKRSVRILLAEDNPVNQKLARMMLTKAGYQVEVAGNGRETVEKYMISPEGFDLIFMDIEMPEIDGMEATQAIRKFEEELRTGDKLTGTTRPGDRHIPIVAMTAHAMRGDRDKCLEAGMDDYVSKPIKREIVFKAVEKWIFNVK